MTVIGRPTIGTPITIWEGVIELFSQLLPSLA
jgi:hypothetical protein